MKPASLTRVDAGRLAKAGGRAFEQRVEWAARMIRAQLVQIPTGAIVVGQRGGRPILRPEKTPFDYVLGKDGEAAFFDAKSTAKTRFPFADMKPHQVRKLHDLELAGFRAGYLVNFRTLDRVVFFNASALKALQPRTSLRPDDGDAMGTHQELFLDRLLSPMVGDDRLLRTQETKKGPKSPRGF